MYPWYGVCPLEGQHRRLFAVTKQKQLAVIKRFNTVRMEWSGGSVVEFSMTIALIIGTEGSVLDISLSGGDGRSLPVTRTAETSPWLTSRRRSISQRHRMGQCWIKVGEGGSTAIRSSRPDQRSAHEARPG